MPPKGSTSKQGLSTSDTDFTMRALRQKEREIKRARGVISCAECRRLKLKCDKKIPCTTCVRRGCPTICPNGLLTSGKGSRFVLADTEELHLKLVDMSERIRELENALEASHYSSGNDLGPHPLLCNDLRAIRFVVGHTIESEDQIPRHKIDPLDSFGALKICDGETRFLGPSAGSEGILLGEDGLYQEDDTKPTELPSELFEFARMWPFSPVFIPKKDVRCMIEAQLPSLERAGVLCENYLRYVSWYHQPVDRDHLMDELLVNIYRHALKVQDQSYDAKAQINPDLHDLALLMSVLACGSTIDLDHTNEPKNKEGQLYYYLSRASLGVPSIFESSSLSSVQTLAMLSLYDILSARKNTLEEGWKVVGIGANIAGSIGLHRDPGRWKLESKIVQRRRKAFWEYYSLICWQCLAGGRHPGFISKSVDVEFPLDDDSITTDDGMIVPSYEHWKFKFVKECLAPVTDRLCADSSPLRYFEVLAFDKKIRDFDEKTIKIRNELLARSDSETVKNFRQYVVIFYKSLLLLYIHRNFFAYTLKENPGSPLKPPLGTSFSVVLTCAMSIISNLSQMRETMSAWLIHFWPIIDHALECAFVVGSVALRCTKTSYADIALQSLNLAITFFEDLDHPVAKHGLPVLLRLREKAQKVDQASTAPSKEVPVDSPDNVENNDIDELSIIRGLSRLVGPKQTHRPSVPQVASSEISEPPTSVPDTPDNLQLDSQDSFLQGLHFVPLGHPGIIVNPGVTSIQQETMSNSAPFSWEALFTQPDESILDMHTTNGLYDEQLADFMMNTNANFSGTPVWNFDFSS